MYSTRGFLLPSDVKVFGQGVLGWLPATARPFPELDFELVLQEPKKLFSDGVMVGLLIYLGDLWWFYGCFCGDVMAVLSSFGLKGLLKVGDSSQASSYRQPFSSFQRIPGCVKTDLIGTPFKEPTLQGRSLFKRLGCSLGVLTHGLVKKRQHKSSLGVHENAWGERES